MTKFSTYSSLCKKGVKRGLKSCRPLANRAGTGLIMTFSGLFLASCAMVSSNSVYDGETRGNYVGCSGDAGSYYLSRTVFDIVLKREGKGNVGLTINIAREPDREHGYCLDFLASRTAEEAIYISKTNNNLLEVVTTKSEDKSAEIITNLISAIFVSLSGNPQFDKGLRRAQASLADQILFQGRYDPFNPGQTALVNNSLKRHGVCLLIEDQIDERYASPMEYCDHPMKYKSVENAIKSASNYGSRAKITNYTKGILFRPRLPHKYYVYYKRRDPHSGRKRWTLVKSRAIAMENDSPLISLAIDRAYFTHRNTTITFDKGALLDVDIDKGSELADAMQIPLAIADSIAALPANIIKVKIDTTNRRTNLIKAQRQLIETLEAKKVAQGNLTGAKNLTDAKGNEVPKGQNRGLAVDRPTPPATPARLNENESQCTLRCARDYPNEVDNNGCEAYCGCLSHGALRAKETQSTIESFCRTNLQGN